MLHSIWTACTLHLSYHYCLQDSVYQHCENSLDLFSVLDPLLFFSPLVFLFPDLVPSFVWVGSYYSLEHFTVGLSEPIIMGYLNPINMCYLNQSHSGGILTYSIYPQPLWLPHREVFQSSGPKKWRGWELTVCADFPLLLIWYLIRTFSYFRKICC